MKNTKTQKIFDVKNKNKVKNPFTIIQKISKNSKISKNLENPNNSKNLKNLEDPISENIVLCELKSEINSSRKNTENTSNQNDSLKSYSETNESSNEINSNKEKNKKIGIWQREEIINLYTCFILNKEYDIKWPFLLNFIEGRNYVQIFNKKKALKSKLTNFLAYFMDNIENHFFNKLNFSENKLISFDEFEEFRKIILKLIQKYTDEIISRKDYNYKILIENFKKKNLIDNTNLQLALNESNEQKIIDQFVENECYQNFNESDSSSLKNNFCEIKSIASFGEIKVENNETFADLNKSKKFLKESFFDVDDYFFNYEEKHKEKNYYLNFSQIDEVELNVYPYDNLSLNKYSNIQLDINNKIDSNNEINGNNENNKSILNNKRKRDEMTKNSNLNKSKKLKKKSNLDINIIAKINEINKENEIMDMGFKNRHVLNYNFKITQNEFYKALRTNIYFNQYKENLEKNSNFEFLQEKEKIIDNYINDPINKEFLSKNNNLVISLEDMDILNKLSQIEFNNTNINIINEVDEITQMKKGYEDVIVDELILSKFLMEKMNESFKDN